MHSAPSEFCPAVFRQRDTSGREFRAGRRQSGSKVVRHRMEELQKVVQRVWDNEQAESSEVSFEESARRCAERDLFLDRRSARRSSKMLPYNGWKDGFHLWSIKQTRVFGEGGSLSPDGSLERVSIGTACRRVRSAVLGLLLVEAVGGWGAVIAQRIMHRLPWHCSAAAGGDVDVSFSCAVLCCAVPS